VPLVVQEKYGPDYELDEDEESDESTDYSSEDSDAEFVTPEVDAAILKIIGRIREGGSELYTGSNDFFKGEAASSGLDVQQSDDLTECLHLIPLQRKRNDSPG